MVDDHLYHLRFSDDELRRARRFWVPICRYLERYIPADGATLDLGAGYCHFINTVRSARKYALDVHADNLARWALPEVEQIVASGHRLPMFATESLDTVFASNVYEHFHTKEDVADSFREVYRTLRRGGRLIVMQPNFAYCADRYFDFFDHRLAFTHRSMAEGLQSVGLRIVRMVPRCLPFTSKQRLPKAPWLVGLYLKLPLLWPILGAQMLLVAEKPR